MASMLLLSRGHLRLATGDAAGALRDFEQIRAATRLSGMENAGDAVARFAARSRTCSSAIATAARALAAEELERARAGARRARCRSRCARPASSRAATRGIDLLRECRDRRRATRRRATSALARSPALGAALRRAGHRRDAREPLREALDLADACGALRLAAAAREELLADRRAAAPRRAQRRATR